uniref:Uncharacterized protein n=1 Tax=Rhizophora mucronata TaxID=61149 RepID=A0A2P2PV19_RHIMU
MHARVSLTDITTVCHLKIFLALLGKITAMRIKSLNGM